MKISSLSPIIQLLVCALLIVFVPLCHCRKIKKLNGDATIDYTCSKTPNFTLCVSALKSDLGSETADAYGFVLILTNIVSAKGIYTLTEINMLLTKTLWDPALISCRDLYTPYIKDVLPAVPGTFATNRAKAADMLGGFAAAAQKCEDGFSGRPSPLEWNKYNADLANVDASIARMTVL